MSDSISVSQELAPYAGRWVALVQDRVAGVGRTPAEAQRLARRNRPKERVTLHFVNTNEGEPLALPPAMAKLRPFLTNRSQPVYLVGGAVRDALMQRASHDLDFVVPQEALRLTYRVANGLGVPAYPLDKERDTGRVMLDDAGMTLDFARFRGASLEADLYDRDFTINAIALPANATTSASLIDPTGGVADLRAGLIRLTQPQALTNDPVRALRAVRQAAAFRFTLTPETAAAVVAVAPRLGHASVERIRDEMLKLLVTDAPHVGLQQLASLQLLPVILPEISALANVTQSAPHYEDVLAHTSSVLRWLVMVETAVLAGTETAVPGLAALQPFRKALQEHFQRPVDGMVNGRVLLRLGALCHDIGKAVTRTVTADGRIRFLNHDQVGAELAAGLLQRLTLSNKAARHVAQIVLGHMRPLLLAKAQGAHLTRRAVYRFFRDIDAAGLDAGLLALADHLATYEGIGDSSDWDNLVQTVRGLFAGYLTQHAEAVAPTPLLDGNELMHALDIRPGPEVGRLLRLIVEAQAAGEVTTREEALVLARAAVSRNR